MRRAAAAIAAALLVAAVAKGALSARRRAPAGFAEAAGRLLDQAESVHARAAAYDEARALRSLGAGRWNGAVTRLDERLDDARVEGAPGAPTDDADVRDVCGALRLDPGRPVLCPLPAGFPLDDVGAVELQATARADATMEIGASSAVLESWPSGDAPERTSVALVPDGERHTYTIDVGDALRWALAPAASVRTVALRVAEGAAVDVAGVRLLGRRAAYPGAVGRMHAAAAGTVERNPVLRGARGLAAGVLVPEEPTVRAGLYLRTGASAAFDVDVPAARPSLRFGAAVLRPGDTVFSVDVIAGARTTNVAAIPVAGLEPWRDQRVDLQPWAGRRVTLRLAARGAAGNVSFWSSPIVASPPAARLNVLVLLEDAERADRLSLYGHRRATTPARARFAARGAVFERAYAQATKTRASCPSFMTSLFPTATGVRASETLPDAYTTLAEVLRSQGFATASFVQNTNAGPAAGLHQGFDEVHYRPLGDAAGVYGAAATWIGEQDRNFFAYVHVLDPHGPYDPPPGFRAFFEAAGPSRPVPFDARLDAPGAVPPTLEGRRALYDGEILANDAQLAALLARLQASGVLERTLVVQLSDHGEMLGERDRWEHEDPAELEVARVPLVIVLPGVIPAARVDEPVALLDVMPTVLDVAGIDARGLLLQGRSLLPLLRGEAGPRVAVTEEVAAWQARDDAQAWGSVFFAASQVLQSRGAAAPRAFDVAAAVATPAAAPGLVESASRLLARLRAVNLSIRQVLTGQARTVRSSAEQQERLRALGYVR